jgi:FR47-like protein
MTIPSTPSTLAYLRDNARALLNEFDAADALACYYTLHHDPRRTELFMHRDAEGHVDGYAVRCQTGFDLFRPLITLRLRGGETALPDLLEEALVPGRPYLMVVPEGYVERMTAYVALTDLNVNMVLRLDPARYQPEMNVLVTRRTDNEGNPRTEIKRGKQVVASAGVNWRSPIFAEVYVNVAESQRQQGYGRSVVSALMAELLHIKVTPLYAVAETNSASRALAEAVGFVETGAREIMGQAVRGA